MQKTHTFIPKNDVTEPKPRRLGFSNNQLKAINKLKDSFKLPEAGNSL